jgi:hypothetical protein
MARFSWLLDRVSVFLLIPLAVIGFIPALLLLVLVLYLAALYHGTRLLLTMILGKQAPYEYPDQHFLERDNSEDESTPTI